MKILVTGALGFIGSNLCSHLLNAGHEIVGFDNGFNPSITPIDRIKQKSGNSFANFKFYQVDIRDLSTMKTICANEKPDYIIHLAAVGSVPRSFADPITTMDVNVKGFASVLSLATLMRVKRIIFASSSSVYGSSPSRVENNGNEHPLSPYALSKQMNEDFAAIWCHGINLSYVGLRFFNVYGEGQLIDSPYSAVIPRFINSQEITIYGDGETTRDFTHVEDVCEAIELSLSSPNSNELYNVCTGSGTSLKRLGSLCGTRKKISFVDARPNDIKESIGSPFKAEVWLKFKAAIGIEEGIARTIKYYESLKGIHTL